VQNIISKLQFTGKW